jgi:hypothetical protein
MNTTQIENILRRAPQPRPPGNLQQRLKAQALSAPRNALPVLIERRSGASRFRRWWPTLAPTAITLACAATFALQQNQLHRLQSDLDKRSIAAPTSARVSEAAGATQNASAPASEQDELTRLKVLIASLTADISKLEQMKTENGRLRAELASRSAGAFTPEETKAMDEARDKAMNAQCVNNLKQLGLAVRVWAIDHHGFSPQELISLTNELGGSFKIMVCPSDMARQPAADASSFTAANCSYEYLAPMAPETEPQRILFRCPIHGNLGLIDGSVQTGVAKNHPNWIVQRDGKLYEEAPQAEVEPVPAPPDAPNQNQ